jgi:hypothetical protein
MGLAGVESPLGLFRVDSLSQCTVDISARGHASAAVPPMRPTQDTTEVTASAGLGSGMDRMVGEGDQDTGMGQLEASDKGRGRVQGTGVCGDVDVCCKPVTSMKTQAKCGDGVAAALASVGEWGWVPVPHSTPTVPMSCVPGPRCWCRKQLWHPSGSGHLEAGAPDQVGSLPAQGCHHPVPTDRPLAVRHGCRVDGGPGVVYLQ